MLLSSQIHILCFFHALCISQKEIFLKFDISKVKNQPYFLTWNNFWKTKSKKNCDGRWRSKNLDVLTKRAIFFLQMMLKPGTGLPMVMLNVCIIYPQLYTVSGKQRKLSKHHTYNHKLGILNKNKKMNVLPLFVRFMSKSDNVHSRIEKKRS